MPHQKFLIGVAHGPGQVGNNAAIDKGEQNAGYGLQQLSNAPQPIQYKKQKNAQADSAEA